MFTQHPGNGGLPQRCVEYLKKSRGCLELGLRDGQLNPKLEKRKGEQVGGGLSSGAGI